MSTYVLAIDQGTTGTTALLVGRDLAVHGRATCEFPQHFPQPGWVEHDVEEVWSSVRRAVEGALQQAGATPRAIHAIGITNQRETTALWDGHTGRAIHRAIVWQDRRTTDHCRALAAAGHEPSVRERTGLVLDPYFSATKMRWLLDHVPEAAARAASGDWLFGTIESLLVHRLTGGAAHVTDVTNASRTLLMSLPSLAWDDDLLALFGVPRAALPRIVPSSGVVGVTRGLGWLPDGIPVAGMAGDQQAALCGQACFAEGEAKCTYGTGAFLLMNTGSRPVASRHGLITTVAWQVGDEVRYALEGSSFIAGAAVQWLRDGLGVIRSADEVEPLARSVPDAGGVQFVPALAGLGAPHWRPEARGLFCGIDRGTTRAHLARAVLEGMALQVVDLVRAMQQDAGRPVPLFKADGGASRNDLLMQLQSDLLGVPVQRPRMVETTALGAAFLAGLATGVWSDTAELQASWQADRTFVPTFSDGQRGAMLSRWAEAVSRA